MTVRVRAYNVGFGDCFLVSFPDDGVIKHMMIDFGNAPGQSNDRFKEIAEDIERETGGHLDVVVISHEHLDHIEGFYSQKAIFGDKNRITIDYVWMGIPSHPDYYAKYPKAEPHKKIREMADEYYRTLKSRRLELAPGFQSMLLNNLSNVDRLNFIRKLPEKSVKYLRRGNRWQDRAFSSVKTHILAPEKDMSVYYDSGMHNISAMARTMNSSQSADKDWWSFPKAARVASGQPPQLTSRDWANLKANIEGGGPEAIRTIDKAQNNTSLVFILEVAGKRLLFPGDAEIESWAMLRTKNRTQMKPVDFLKVSHHGSHNGTLEAALDDLLPLGNAANAKVMVSTKRHVYGTVNPVPDELVAMSSSPPMMTPRTSGSKRTSNDAASLAPPPARSDARRQGGMNTYLQPSLT